MSSATPQLARRRRLRVRDLRETHRSSTRRTTVAWLAGIALLFAAIGFLVGGRPIVPISAGTHARWGGWAMEAAFTYAVVHAVVIAFRGSELILRDSLAPMILAFPIRAHEVVADRLGAVLRESLFYAVPALGFLAGAIVASPTVQIALTFAYLVAVVGLNGSLAFGLTFSIVRLGERGVDASHAGVGTASFFATAPAVVLAVLGLTDLLLKLGCEELFRSLAEQGQLVVSRAALVVFALVGVLAMGGVIAGIRTGRRALRSLLSSFDRAMKQSISDEEWVTTRTIRISTWTKGLPIASRQVVERMRTEFRRLHGFLVIANVLVALLLLIAGFVWGEHPYLRFISPAVAAIWYIGVIRVRERMQAVSLGGVDIDTMLVSSGSRQRAVSYASWVESTRTLIPLAIAAVVAALLKGTPNGVLTAMLGAGLLGHAIEGRMPHRDGSFRRIVSCIGGVLLAACGLLINMGDSLIFVVPPVLCATLLAGWLLVGRQLRQTFTKPEGARTSR